MTRILKISISFSILQSFLRPIPHNCLFSLLLTHTTAQTAPHSLTYAIPQRVGQRTTKQQTSQAANEPQTTQPTRQQSCACSSSPMFTLSYVDHVLRCRHRRGVCDSLTDDTFLKKAKKRKKNNKTYRNLFFI